MALDGKALAYLRNSLKEIHEIKFQQNVRFQSMQLKAGLVTAYCGAYITLNDFYYIPLFKLKLHFV